ncbi:hypothetical protein EV368DRAFT_68051 [Lentinula lateritia]|uniref:Uncharacterized protein n=1 Tax=Lentinula aff. lateritia TaxID=2804960 RepID=A0ACC1TL00_9AGAR|nr:hypothetical protein F5876DRAFT_69846 [Lentinula aff. lateritia]KAJ3848693.1 hypothetical protein EV368DRAFT_68051 [Lentinula lateritia]
MSSPSTSLSTETWGCQLIAYMLDAVLYGVAMVLVGQYFYLHSGKDSKLIKGTIVALGSLGTLQFTFISHQMYIDFVTRFNAPASLDFIVFTAPSQLLFIYLTAFIAQWWILFNTEDQQNLHITAFLQAGFGQSRKGTVSYDLTCSNSDWSFQFAALYSYLKSELTGNPMLYSSGIKIWTEKVIELQTNGIINKMIIYAINRGAVTSISALLNMILFVSVPGTFIFMIPLVPSCPLYVISVVSMLIVRTSLRSELGGGITTLPSGSYALESHTRVQYAGDIHGMQGSAVLTFNSGCSDPTIKLHRSDLIPNGV